MTTTTNLERDLERALAEWDTIAAELREVQAKVREAFPELADLEDLHFAMHYEVANLRARLSRQTCHCCGRSLDDLDDLAFLDQ
jgi:hypothetical protein